MIMNISCALFNGLSKWNSHNSKKLKHYITTPIFYANSDPHIGHLYTTLLADALSRYEVVKNPKESVDFMTGTDEHGIKIYQVAKAKETPEHIYVEHISRQYKDLFSLYSVKYSDFLRTTEKRHKDCATALWNNLMKGGHIYKGEYSGWYCIPDEAFIAEQLLYTDPNGKKFTIEGNRPVDFVKEINYKFSLKSFKSDLLQWLKEDRVYPIKFNRILIDWIEEGSVLEDISVSRPKQRVSWGIPVPNDEDHTMYVWLDALSSYLTSAGYPGTLNHWPPDVQIIGKDILKFHGVFWPAFLIGAGLEPPKKLLCHSHWIIDGEKMSKSKGNVIDPVVEAKKFTSEGLRYFLLREGVPHSDGNYTSVKIQRILNSELADTLGNLLNRCTGNLVNPGQTFPALIHEDYVKYCASDGLELIKSVEALPDLVNQYYSNFELYKGIDAIISTLHIANEFFERKKPWELRKSPEKSSELKSVLNVTMETLRVCGILLSPITPILSDRLLTKLNVPESERTLKYLSVFSWQEGSAEKNLDKDKTPLFLRLKLP